MKIFFRQPKKLIACFVILFLSAAILLLGITVFASGNAAGKRIEELYTTVATAEQLPDSTETYSVTSSGETLTYDVPVYTEKIPRETFEKLPYLLTEPLTRPTLFTHAFHSDTGEKIYTEDSTHLMPFKRVVYLFEPDGNIEVKDGQATCLIKVNDILYGKPEGVTKISPMGDSVSLTSYSSSAPLELEPGKEYIGYLEKNYYNEGYSTVPLVRYPREPDPDSLYMKNEPLLPFGITEYSEGFFETDLGKAFEEVMASQKQFDDNAFIAVPTRSIEELTGYAGAKITEGRMITEEEFKNKSKVCVVDESMLRDKEDSDYINSLKVGDRIELEVFATSYTAYPAYYTSSGQGVTYPGGIIGMDSKTETYEIVGAYHGGVSGGDAAAGLAQQQIIFPYDGPYGVNVIGTGPYSRYTTSFTVENGKLDSFVAETDGLFPNVDFNINDGGYSSVSRAVALLRSLGIVLVILGAAAFASILIFLIVFCIGSKKRDIGIELSLGEKRSVCCGKIFLESMAVILLAVGVAAGVSYTAAEAVQSGIYSSVTENTYDTAYSDFAQYDAAQNEYVPDFSSDPLLFAVAALAAVGFSALLILVYTARIIQKGPMLLLSSGE